MGRWLAALCGVVAATAGTAGAAIVGTRLGALASQGAVGASTHQLRPPPVTGVWIASAGATGSTWQVEMSPDGGTTWCPVYVDGVTLLSIAAADAAVFVPDPPPHVLLRTNVTVFGAGTFTAAYALSAPESP